MKTTEEIMSEYKNMPKLCGSEKQIEWAEKIRKNLFFAIGLFIEENQVMNDQKVKEEIEKAKRSIFSESSARIYIGNRDQKACLRICEEIEFLNTRSYSWEKDD